MPKRFVSWAAVSSLPQAKKVSVDDQLKTNQEHIERWDGILHKELPIRGKSRFIGSLEEACATITEYARLRDMIKHREFDVLIYLDRSRLGRKRILIDSIIDLCDEAGILTYATESPPSSLELERNFAHKVVGALESILAQEEVTKIQARHEMGMMHRVRMGNFANKVAYGWSVDYIKEGDKPVKIVTVNEEAKAIIETILDLFVYGGASKKTIKEMMIQRGVTPPRGVAWTESAVACVINLAWRYAGYVELNIRSKKREYVRAKSKWPALISEELAAAVMAEKAKRARAKRSVGRGVHRFSHLVWCDRCQRRMIAHYTWKPNRAKTTLTRVENYRCTHAGVPCHDKYQISNVYLLDSVHKAILWVQVESNRQALQEAYVDKAPEIRAAIEKTRRSFAKIEEATQRADDAYVMGDMTIERYQRQVENLAAQRNKIELEIARLEAELQIELHDSQREQRLAELANEGLKWLESDDLAAANAWFRRHLKLSVNNDDPEYRVRVEYL